jgi:hypothetical protein
LIFSNLFESLFRDDEESLLRKKKLKLVFSEIRDLWTNPEISNFIELIFWSFENQITNSIMKRDCFLNNLNNRVCILIIATVAVSFWNLMLGSHVTEHWVSDHLHTEESCNYKNTNIFHPQLLQRDSTISTCHYCFPSNFTLANQNYYLLFINENTKKSINPKRNRDLILRSFLNFKFHKKINFTRKVLIFFLNFLIKFEFKFWCCLYKNLDQTD